jgi:O-antigen ligase
LAILLAGVAVAAAFFTYGDFLADRLSQGFASNDRLSVYSLTWLSIADLPILGFGDGTFEEAFRMYRDGGVGPFGAWDKAHNTYLEMLQGLGAPAAALLLLGLAFLAGRCVHAASTRSRDAVAPLAASAATIVVALHALVDFSLQMQAVALTFAALLGAGVAQSWSAKIATEQ